MVKPKHRVCKVKGCRFYGKKMANWAAHALEAHQLKMGLKEGLPLWTSKSEQIAMRASSKDARYRKLESCMYPDCKRKNSLYRRINRHLPKHGLSKQRYELIKDMMKVQAKFINKTKGSISTSYSDFCPAVQEEYPGCEVEFPEDWFKSNTGDEAITSTLPKSTMMDEDVQDIVVGPPSSDQPSTSRPITRSASRAENLHPNMFLFSETLLSREIVVSNASKQVTLTPEDGEFQVTLRFKKILRSPNHQRCFAWSLFWPSERRRIKLRRETINNEDEFESFRDITRALQNIDGEGPKPLEYQCYLCHQYHRLYLYSTPTVANRPSEWDK